MARKLYLANAGAPEFDPTTTLKGTWSDTTQAGSSGGLLKTPTGASATSFLTETNTSPTFDVVLAHWTSNAIPRSFTLSGTVSWIIATSESSASADLVTKCHIWVSQANTTTLRGTLLSNFVGSTEWPTTIAGMTDGAQTLTPVDVKEGDYLMIEFGYRATNSVATAFIGTLGFGTTGSPDLAVGDTGTTVRPSTIEFSQDIFGPHLLNNQGSRPRPFAPGLAR